MLSGVEVKAGGDLDRSGSLEVWTCGCAVVGSMAAINVRCIDCGNVFKKMNKKNKLPERKKDKIEKVRIELVNNIQTLASEAGEIQCPRCEGTGEIKIFTQEWDRIKSHASPCPECRSQEWQEWSSGRRIVGDRDF